MIDLVPLLDHPTAIVGATGSGKTFAAKGAVEEIIAAGRRVIIIDPTGAWWGLRAGADGDEAGGFPVIIFGGEHADVEITPDGETGKALALALADRDVQAIIDISEMTGGEKNRFLTPFLEHLYAKNKAALHIVVDEADEVAAQRLADGEQRLFGIFDKIVRRGRIKGFRPLMISQRPAVIHKNVLSQIGTLIAMKLPSPQDRKAIEDWVKGNADADQAREVMKSLPGLARGEGWVWSPADSVLDRVTFPAIQTFDSSRTPEIGEVVTAPALAAVDVAALRTALVVEEAEVTAKPARVASKGEIEVAEKRGFDVGWQQGLDEGIIRGEATGAAKALAAVRSRLDDLRVSSIVATDGGSAQAKPPAPVAKHQRKLDAKPTNQVSGSKVELGAERKPLAVLAASYPAGFSEPQWATLAGFKRTGGTWSTYKSRLRTRGLIEQSGDLWHATETGVAALGEILPAIPSTPSERLEMWKGKVPGVGPMLDALHNASPATLSREELAHRLGLAASGGTFGTYLSRLRSNGLIEEPTKGSYRLSIAITGEA